MAGPSIYGLVAVTHLTPLGLVQEWQYWPRPKKWAGWVRSSAKR